MNFPSYEDDDFNVSLISIKYFQRMVSRETLHDRIKLTRFPRSTSIAMKHCNACFYPGNLYVFLFFFLMSPLKLI
jgi:hypothetical protein